ncbi:MAG: 50S ribosomal protein L25/general stress protein Ctc [Vicingus serpentipes]|nr:50S ribosomal protein L25/general stress protein Ctc [Vicingus serpentipes]
MKSVALTGNKRAERGSSNANALRKEEKVPCVIYGGKENIHFTVNEIAFGKIINSPEVFFVDLDIDGTKVKTIIQDVQFHPVTDRVTHVDFIEVVDNKPLIVSLPVFTTGASRGVLNGGKLRMVTRKLKVKGLPAALPEKIELDITNLRIGQSIKVADVNLDGLSILDAANAVVVAVKMSRVAVAEEEEEAEGEEGAETGDAPAAEEAEAKTEEAAPAE